MFLEIFVQKTGFFSLCAAPLARRLGLGAPNQKWFAFLDLAWKIMTFGAWTRSLGKFWIPRRSKTLKKWPLCPYFDTQEAVLGDWSFGGENGCQIQKFHLGWKLDRQVFPKSTLGLNFYFRKSLKISTKVVRRIQKLARRTKVFCPIFHLLAQKFGQFD